MDKLLAPSSVDVSELKANPNAVLKASGNKPVAILSRKKPVGYLLTARAWKNIHDILEGKELLGIAEERLADGQQSIPVSLDDL